MVAYPRDWKEGTIGDLFNVSAGGDVKKQWYSKYRTQSHPYEIFSNGIENRGLYGYTSTAVYAGNAVTVTARGTIGQAFYRERAFDAIIRLLVLSPKNDNIKPKFYEYFINSQVIFEKENTGVPQLTAPKIKEKAVPILGGDEQESIIDALSKFDTYIDDLAELIEKKRGIRDGALADLINGRIRLDNFNGEWEKTTIGACADILQGGTPNTANMTYWKGDIIWVTPSEITKLKGMYISDSERKITSAGLQNSSAQILPVGTILLCSRATIGELAIAKKQMATNQGFKNLICRNGVDNIFMAYLLTTLKGIMISKAIGTTFLEISKTALSEIEIVIPQFQEQRAIASVLTAMDEEIEALEIERDKMIQIREGAMDDLLTGRVRLTR